MADSLVQKDFTGAFDYSTQLLASAQCAVGDRLQHLNILQQLHSAELPGAVKNRATTIGDQLGGGGDDGFVDDCQRTFRRGGGLVERSEHSDPVAIARSPRVGELLLRGHELAGADEFHVKRRLGRDGFFTRGLFVARVGQLGDAGAADGQWNDAVAKAGVRFGALTTLMGLANRWGLQREREDLLWQITKLFPAERGAWQELERDLFVAGDTRKLNQLYALLLSFFPQNADIKNNLAVTSLLLKTNLNQAYIWAKEVHEQKPDDPGVTSTYAYALHLQGRTQEGLEAMEKLKKETLEQPSIALYFGVLLSASGEPDKAAHFLALARSGGTMLPEEKQLLAGAVGDP